jgi:non-ribosomal peptide synthase protein (TIGR01720 family)
MKAWAERLVSYADSEELHGELDYWLAPVRQEVAPLPVDFAGENTWTSARSVRRQLTEAETRALLQEAPRRFGTEIEDALLAALALAVTDWTGASSVLIDMRGHGRESLFAGLDVSRTMGWFAATFPLLLDLEGATQPLAALEAVRQQRQQLPNRGMGYDILRYLSPDPLVRQQLRQLPQPQLRFNYQTRINSLLSPRALFRRLQTIFPSPTRTHPLFAGGLRIVTGIGENRLVIDIQYGENVHAGATIERLADACLDALRAVIASTVHSVA